MSENWKQLDNYSRYKFSSSGEAVSLCDRWGNERKLKVKHSSNGYCQVWLKPDDGGRAKWFSLHRIVATLFIDNPDPNVYTDVNHKDENKDNNSASNLEWCTHKENMNYGTRNSRTMSTKGFIDNVEKSSKSVLCLETGITYNSTKDVYRKTGIAYQNISACCNGRQKTAGGFHWKFI